MNMFALATYNVAGRQIRIEQMIGAGGFGVVYRVRKEATGKLFALKDIVCQNPAAIDGALQEIQVLNSLAHPNIIQLMAADRYIDMTIIPHVLIVMEYCSGGNLNDRLARPSNDFMNLKWMRQIADALAYLHSRNPPVVHRDLKPENVLLTNPVNEDVKLADFGLARTFISLRHSQGPITDAQYYMQTGAGTHHYMAPEVFAGHYTEKADVFSLGCLFVAIVERSCLQLPNGKRIYGAFASTLTHGMVGLGFAMYVANGYPNSTVLSTRTLLNTQQLIYDLLSYDYHQRIDASDASARVLQIQTANQPICSIF